MSWDFKDIMYKRIPLLKFENHCSKRVFYLNVLLFQNFTSLPTHDILHSNILSIPIFSLSTFHGRNP